MWPDCIFMLYSSIVLITPRTINQSINTYAWTPAVFARPNQNSRDTYFPPSCTVLILMKYQFEKRGRGKFKQKIHNSLQDRSMQWKSRWWTGQTCNSNIVVYIYVLCIKIKRGHNSAKKSRKRKWSTKSQTGVSWPDNDFW